ncbi:MAG TPA: diguanylate cyclase [Thermoleophilaceae bacterium]|jgi:diguanylate cyclase (GGDEF)-like protein
MKILVVDDSPTPRLVLKRELEAMGHECLVAEDGVAGWELLQETDVDVVISDWMMPRMDGDELCRRVRARASSPYAYFILHTSLDDRQHVVEGMEAGADDYLTKPFDRDELATRLIAAKRVTGLHRRIAAQQQELERLNDALFADSRSDALTGLGNRRSQDEDLDVLAARTERYGHSFCVALFDIDHFKAYNDTAGHLAGDDVLRSIADTLQRQGRRGDTFYRYGGEELLVVFPDQTLETAAIAAERMRDAIESLELPHPGRDDHSVVTVSAGIACYEPDSGDEVSIMLERADAALYAAKEAGRNRVVTRERARAAG